MKPNEKTTLDKLRPGDIFTMTPGGIHLVKGYKKRFGIYTPCTIRGGKDEQYLSDRFAVYFIQRKPQTELIKKPAAMPPVQLRLIS